MEREEPQQQIEQDQIPQQNIETAQEIITLDKWIILKHLGTGAFGKVKHARHSETGQEAALKIMIDNNTEINKKSFMDEKTVMGKLVHPNIRRLIDYSEDGVYTKKTEKKGVIYEALELAENGEMHDYILLGKAFRETIARFYFIQLLDAIEYIHKEGYAHRDIKAENILLDKDYNLKLADFGFAKLLSGKNNTGKMVTV